MTIYPKEKPPIKRFFLILRDISILLSCLFLLCLVIYYVGYFLYKEMGYSPQAVLLSSISLIVLLVVVAITLYKSFRQRDQRNIVLCFILVLLVAVMIIRWEEAGYKYLYRYQTYDEFFSSANSVKLHELLSIFNISPSDEFPESNISMYQYQRDRLTAQKRTTFYPWVDYYGKGFSYGSSGWCSGRVSYEKPFIVHGATAFVYTSIGITVIALLKGSKGNNAKR